MSGVPATSWECPVCQELTETWRASKVCGMCSAPLDSLGPKTRAEEDACALLRAARKLRTAEMADLLRNGVSPDATMNQSLPPVYLCLKAEYDQGKGRFDCPAFCAAAMLLEAGAQKLDLFDSPTECGLFHFALLHECRRGIGSRQGQTVRRQVPWL